MERKLPPLWRDLNEIRRLRGLHLLLEALLTGAFTGLVLGAFRLLSILIANFLLERNLINQALEPWLFWGLGLALLAFLSQLFLKIEPLISGSGIPQVELLIRGLLPPMSWRRVLLCKFVGTLISLSAGLSLGREGPSIQMGACVGQGVGSLWHQSNEIKARFLIGGSVAGLTAAFSAPIAGLLFAFEEMRTVLTLPLFLFCLLAAISSNLVVDLLGLGLVFPLKHLEPLALNQIWIFILVGLSCGLLSVIYNKMLIGLTLSLDRLELTSFKRIFLAYGLTWLLFKFYPYVLTNFGLPVLELENLDLSLSFLLGLLCLKVFFSSLSFASGVAGGLLMPMLSAGALLGALLSQVLLPLNFISQNQEGVILTMSMAGLFAGTVRAPLTGGFLLLEMTWAWGSTPLILATALLAGWVCNRLGLEPVYDSLKVRVLMRRRDLHV